MHPLVARIHPSLRTAFFAFVVARAAMWFGLETSSAVVLPRIRTDAGTPLYQGLHSLAALLEPIWQSPALAIAAELTLFAGVVAVYRFARRDGMPQTADRAAWLWIASPAMVFATPGSDFAFAYAFTALSMGAILRPVWSALALSVAVAIRPEAIVIWPAMAWAWWAYRDGDPLDRMVLAVVPAASFAVTILSSIFVGEPSALFREATGWRHDLVWHGFAHHSTDIIVGALLIAAIAVALRMWDETPRGWIWVTMPVLGLVAMHDPVMAGVAVVPFAVPLFVQLAKFSQDMGFERMVLSASLVVLTLLCASQ